MHRLPWFLAISGICLLLNGCLTCKTLIYTLTVQPDTSGMLVIEGKGVSSTETDKTKALEDIANFYSGGFSKMITSFGEQFGLTDPKGELSNCEGTGCDGKVSGTYSDLLRVALAFASPGDQYRLERTSEYTSVSFEMDPSGDSPETRFVVKSFAKIIEHTAKQVEEFEENGMKGTQYTWKLAASAPTTVAFKIALPQRDNESTATPSPSPAASVSPAK
jgi:hypothetical protein